MQSSDGLLQVGLASFVLFSPQRQPDATAIAVVLAITLLPFSILGPFVSIVLDRWSRRQIMLITCLIWAGVVLGMAALVQLTGAGHGLAEIAFYGCVLVAMSLNRFVLASLSAALPHTIDPDEYLVANAVVPTVGPAGALLGAGIGAVGRLVLGNIIGVRSANAVLFCLVAAGLIVGAVLTSRFHRNRLGPDDVVPPHAKDVVVGLAQAVRHLTHRRPAGLGLLSIGAQRIVYGIVTVAMILAYRNYFHPVTAINAALADLAIYTGCAGAGFVLASVLTPPLAARIGIRTTMIASLAAAAVFQIVPGAIYHRVPLVVAAFFLGLAAQCLKICVDTLVQAHVADEFKGRTFVLYDMTFNVALVVAAVIAAFLLPADGKSVPILIGLAAVYLAYAIVFAALSGRIGSAAFNRGRPLEPADPA